MTDRRIKNKYIMISEKLSEAAKSVIPIVAVVLVLSLTIAPIPTDLMLSFLLGTLFLVLGMGLFSLGAEMSMTPIGSKIGTSLTATKNLPLILIVSFALGFAVTIAEPDLQVLAQTVPHIPNKVLIVTVGAGVGFFLTLCMLRILTGAKLRWFLIACYTAVFALAAFTDKDFLGIAFDSGGVTTGPMTVPFILAFGVGVAHSRSDKDAEADSFGLVALCSIGPILSVLLLGLFSSGADATAEFSTAVYDSTVHIGQAYLSEIPHCFSEVSLALMPIFIIFLLFQVFSLKLSKRKFTKIIIGLLYTYVGLVLFLTGVNVGFSSLGAVLGITLADGKLKYLVVPIAAILGWFVISAEPAVAVLEKQIEEVSAGAISGKSIKLGLSVAISVAMAISALRVITGISLMWFLIPGYVISLLLSFFVPDIYTAIAFDSGGVVSGPMTATFMLQFIIGVCSAFGGNILRDAFGLVALVAMMPLLTIQAIGFISERKRKEENNFVPEEYDDLDIIEFWEEA